LLLFFVLSCFRVFVLFSIDLQRMPAAALCRHDQSVNPEWNDLAELWFADVSRNDPSLRSG